MESIPGIWIRCTPEEEIEIQRGIALDPDTIDMSDESLVLVPFSHRAEQEAADKKKP